MTSALEALIPISLGLWCYSHLGGSVDERRPVYFMVAQKQREDEGRLRVPNLLFKGMS